MVRRIGGPGYLPDDAPDAWPLAVAEMCVPILESLPEHLRVGAASTLYTESRTHSDADTPWSVIFNDDTPDWIGAQLLSTCLTPQNLTPSQNPDLRPTVDAMGRILKNNGIELGAATTALSGLLIQIAARKPNVPFVVYADEARHTPMKYSWSNTLIQQFGETTYHDVLAAEAELKRIIQETDVLTTLHYDMSELSYQVSPDDTSDLIYGFLPVDERYSLYISAAHKIRGLAFE